ncbi:hypothetical protein E1A91_D11G332900v1 [Gossypium mustelinum]|uniref:Uncharacterized protein n=1 Tax=Gossypium mustelinum TaxID=34275 RepID=A0A5D2T0G3_GOSMU|nr:hypothetical protein E1A91_D11G332900v1 [Gossypium mustelinum]
MEVESVLLALLLINALTFSQLNLAVEAAESVPLSPSDDFSKELKALSRRNRRITPPSPRINAPVHFKSPPPSPRPPPPPRSPPPPCLWRPPTAFG